MQKCVGLTHHNNTGEQNWKIFKLKKKDRIKTNLHTLAATADFTLAIETLDDRSK